MEQITSPLVINDNKKLIVESIRFIFGLIYFLLLSRPSKKNEKKKYQVALDDIHNFEEEYHTFEKVFLHLKGKVVCIVESLPKAKKPDQNFEVAPDKKGYDTFLCFKVFILELLFGTLTYYRISKRLGINFFRVYLSALNCFLYNITLFSKIDVTHTISFRDYGNFSIKQDIIRSNGGKGCSSIQRARHGYTAISSYLDLDVYFSIGEQAFHFLKKELHGTIRNCHPVGALTFNSKFKASKPDDPKQYDIIFLDQILLPVNNFYIEYINDHLKTYEWLKKFSNENPDLKIGFQMRSRFSYDEKVLAILDESNITCLEGQKAYEVTHLGKMYMTYYSTVGYEYLGSGYKFLFLDPRQACPFISKDSRFKKYVASNYTECVQKTKKILAMDKEDWKEYRKDFEYFAISSEHTSRKIAEYLNEQS